ncbi:hypothetical protein SynA15127_02439 [Synechococcus sp. A15-127]|nr:hypothetical protein SynA15127_02439 [Synechococcus sp. A15-127]
MFFALKSFCRDSSQSLAMNVVSKSPVTNNLLSFSMDCDLVLVDLV